MSEWTVGPGQKLRVFVAVRVVKPGFAQYLGADGRVKANASNFRSQEAAQAAIDKHNRIKAAQGKEGL